MASATIYPQGTGYWQNVDNGGFTVADGNTPQIGTTTSKVTAVYRGYWHWRGGTLDNATYAGAIIQSASWTGSSDGGSIVDPCYLATTNPYQNMSWSTSLGTGPIACTSIVQGWVNTTNVAYGFFAVNDSATGHNGPTASGAPISITYFYNTAPTVTLSSPADGATVTTGTPTITATFTDPDTQTIQPWFEVHAATGNGGTSTAVWWSGNGSALSGPVSGSSVSVTVGITLPSGGWYMWRARANDGVAEVYSSGWRYFFVNSTKPVSAVLAVTLSCVGAAVRTRPVSGALGVTMSASGSAIRTRPVAAALPITASLDAIVRRQRFASAALPITLTTTGTAGYWRDVSAALGITLSMSGTARLTHAVSAALQIAVDLVGNVGRTRPVSAALPIDLALDAATPRAERFASASLPITFDLDGLVRAERSLAAALPITLDVQSTVTRIAQLAASLPISVELEPGALARVRQLAAEMVVELYLNHLASVGVRSASLPTTVTKVRP